MYKYFTGEDPASKKLTAHIATTFKKLVDSIFIKPVILAIAHSQFLALDKAAQSKAKQVGYAVACTFSSSPWHGRKLEFACPCHLIFIDVDDSDDARLFVENPASLVDLLNEFNFVAYQTASSTLSLPRMRIVVDAASIAVDRYPEAVLTIAGLMGLSQVTRESVIACQPMYFPTLFNGQCETLDDPMLVTHFDGRPFIESDISTDTESFPPLSSGNKPATAPRSTGDALDDYLLHYEPPDAGFTIQTAKDALRFVTATCSRPEWIAIAAALRHQFPGEQADEAYEVWHDWSSTGDNYKGRKDCETNWRSLQESPRGRAPITIRTLIMRAKVGGWEYPAVSHTTTGTGTPLPPLPLICCAADLIVAESVKPRPQQLVQGLVHISEKLLLSGASKSYKSWALLDLACSVGTGTPFWGFTTTQGRVLLLNYEIRPWFFAARLKQVEQAKGCGLLDNVDVWNLRGHRAGFDRVLCELKALLMSTPYALIVIDPLYSGLAGRNENDATEMADFMNSIEVLAEHGPAVAMGHHFAKGNSAMRESLDRASGSGVFARDPDGIVTLNRHQTDGAFVAEFTLRNFAPMASKGLILNFPLLLPDASLDVEKIKGAQVRSKAAVTVEAIVALLPKSGGIKTGEWQKLAHDETGVSSSRFYVLRNEAKSRDLFRNEGGLNERVPMNSSTAPQLLPEYSEE